MNSCNINAFSQVLWSFAIMVDRISIIYYFIRFHIMRKERFVSCSTLNILLVRFTYNINCLYHRLTASKTSCFFLQNLSVADSLSGILNVRKRLYLICSPVSSRFTTWFITLLTNAWCLDGSWYKPNKIFENHLDGSALICYRFCMIWMGYLVVNL